MKNVLFLKLAVLFIFPFTLFLLSGCTSTQTEQGTDWEIWVGELTGMIDAELKMFFSQFEEGQNAYLVKGTFKGDIENVSGEFGSGRMSGEIKGKVKNGIFNVGIRGRAYVSAGTATIDGKMIGTLSKTQAFGTWSILARDIEGTLYNFSGEWRAEKVDS
ncbi:MAG: hypothetical protein PVF32_26710 [Desulfobacterales bacterium]|jgi:hypothetical protein